MNESNIETCDPNNTGKRKFKFTIGKLFIILSCVGWFLLLIKPFAELVSSAESTALEAVAGLILLPFMIILFPYSIAFPLLPILIMLIAGIFTLKKKISGPTIIIIVVLNVSLIFLGWEFYRDFFRAIGSV